MILDLAMYLIAFAFVIGLWLGDVWFKEPCTCPETLPKEVTDMFTIKGDTLVIKQGVDFVISTRAVNVDTAGILHRKTLHNPK